MSHLIRVLLADDHPFIRSGIRTTLAAESDIPIVGEAVDGHSVRELCQTLRPNILLLDLNMPGPPPSETMRYIREHCPMVHVVVLTAYDGDAYIRGLIGAGAGGYVLKDEAPDTVVRAIRIVMQGGSWFSQSVVEKFVRRRPAMTEKDGVVLSEKEHQLLTMIARGWDNIRIAHELHLAEQTVRNYTSRLYDNLGVKSRAEAIVWARERGLGEL